MTTDLEGPGYRHKDDSDYVNPDDVHHEREPSGMLVLMLALVVWGMILGIGIGWWVWA